ARPTRTHPVTLHDALPIYPLARRRLDVDDRVAVLAAAAGLAHEAALDLLHALADRLAVGHLRPADVGVDLELAREPVDDHLEVQDRKSTRLNSSHVKISYA